VFEIIGSKYLNILHDDDLVMEGLFSKLIEFLSNNQEFMFVDASIQIIEEFDSIK
jgi:hypothetical protein